MIASQYIATWLHVSSIPFKYSLLQLCGSNTLTHYSRRGLALYAFAFRCCDRILMLRFIKPNIWFVLPVTWLICLFQFRSDVIKKMPRCFSIKFHSETQVSSRLGMSGGRSPRHAQNPLSGEQRKTLSITHHALSPLPSHHHLYIISSHQLTKTF